MSSSEYLDNDSRELEQLNIARALLEDATRETALWLQAIPSKEEGYHLLAMQERLAGLQRIITRRMERCKIAKDEWDWPETVRELLRLLEQAKEARGNIVGKGLARLAERLPRELPGHKKPRVPPPVRPVSIALTSARVTEAPAPPTSVGGLGLAPYHPKPTHRPSSPPAYFPGDLWPQTVVILDEACKSFPDQRKTLELSKYVISKMTPLFCEAVKAGKMEAGAVLHKGLGGMEDLLHSLLVYNCDHDNERFRLAQQARNSDECRELAKAIVDAQAEVQHTSKPQTVKQSAAERIGRNIDKLRKECGWSLDKLAEKTGIDKKAILSHVHGESKPNPKTQREYAQAFTKELNRAINANSLED